MAARRSWVVYVDDDRQLIDNESYAGKYNALNGNPDIMSVFFKEALAFSFAKHIAEKYPGKDVHVYKQTFAFTTQAKPVETKQWNDYGELVPL